MFKKKVDRRALELDIQFNLTAISHWLKSSGEHGSIENVSVQDWAWDDKPVMQSYKIDVLPSGEKSDLYFHRQAAVISNNISGLDYLEHASEEVKDLARESEIVVLAWEPWRNYLVLRVNRKPILAVPLEEFVELQTKGTLSRHGGINDKDQVVRLPIRFDDSNQPIEFMDISRGSASDRSVGFSNALANVAVNILNFTVEY